MTDPTPDLHAAREEIERLDRHLLELLKERMAKSRKGAGPDASADGDGELT